MQTHFWSTQFLFEINDHVTKTLIENSLLVQFELMKVDQKWDFEQFINHVIMNSGPPPRIQFWSRKIFQGAQYDIDNITCEIYFATLVNFLMFEYVILVHFEEK